VMNDMFDMAKKIADGASVTEGVFSTMGTVLRKIVDTMREWMTGANAGGDPTGAPIVIDEVLIGYATKLEQIIAPLRGMIAVVKDMLDYARDVARNSAQIATVLPQEIRLVETACAS